MAKLSSQTKKILKIVGALALIVAAVLVALIYTTPLIKPKATVTVERPPPVIRMSSLQPSSATVVSPMSVDPKPGAMAPTTLTTPANATKEYKPAVTTLDGRFWNMPAFPDYSIVPKTRPPGHRASLYADESTQMLTFLWQDVPMTVCALYFVYDRDRFHFGNKGGIGVTYYAGKDAPEEEKRSTFSVVDVVTNPQNPVEGAVLLYDKRGAMYRFLLGLDRFLVEMPGQQFGGTQAFLSAVSFFYVDTSGQGNFLTLDLIESAPPRRATVVPTTVLPTTTATVVPTTVLPTTTTTKTTVTVVPTTTTTVVPTTV